MKSSVHTGTWAAKKLSGMALALFGRCPCDGAISHDIGYSSPSFSTRRTDIIAVAVVTVGFAHEAFPDSAVASSDLTMDGIVGADLRYTEHARDFT
jgi:hypothetical protein